jgi:hypothetical protein
MYIYLWVPGREQPAELVEWSRPATRTAKGTDYWFETPQQAFDAAEVLRARRQPYELQMTPAERKPWIKKHRIRMDCF